MESSHKRLITSVVFLVAGDEPPKHACVYLAAQAAVVQDNTVKLLRDFKYLIRNRDPIVEPLTIQSEPSLLDLLVQGTNGSGYDLHNVLEHFVDWCRTNRASTSDDTTFVAENFRTLFNLETTLRAEHFDGLRTRFWRFHDLDTVVTLCKERYVSQEPPKWARYEEAEYVDKDSLSPLERARVNLWNYLRLVLPEDCKYV